MPPETWLLDERFVGLLTDKEIVCTDLARKAYRETDNTSSHLLRPLRDGLASFGAKS